MENKRYWIPAIGIGLFCLLSGGLAVLDTHTPWVRNLQSQAPGAAGPLAFSTEFGKTMFSAAQIGGDTLVGSVDFLMHPDEWDNRTEKAKTQFLSQHPVLKAGVYATEETVKKGQTLVGQVSETVAPSPQTQAKRLKAKAQILDKQTELFKLEAKMANLRGEVRQLQKVADPVSNLVPDGFALLGVASGQDDKTFSLRAKQDLLPGDSGSKTFALNANQTTLATSTQDTLLATNLNAPRKTPNRAATENAIPPNLLTPLGSTAPRKSPQISPNVGKKGHKNPATGLCVCP